MADMARFEQSQTDDPMFEDLPQNAPGVAVSTEDLLDNLDQYRVDGLDEDIAANWRPFVDTSNLDPSRRKDGSSSKSGFPCIRSYHREPNCPYMLPDDVPEGARLNVQHQIFKHIFTTNYRGPSEQALERGGLRILDVGYGSGIWLAEMSRDFPDCEYFGVDVSVGMWARTFSEEMPSVKILQGNVMERLPFADNTFDYVHQHNIELGITTDAWENVMSELHRVTKPGGYIDISEVDLTPQPTLGPTSVRFFAGLLQALRARRVDTNAGRRLRSLVDSHGGFGYAKDIRLCLPVGDWDGQQIGLLWKEDVRRQLGAMREFGRAVFGGGERWWDEVVNDVVEEEAELKCFVNQYRVWAQKAF